MLGTSSPPYPRRGARVRRLRLRGAQRRPHAAEISSRLLEGANPEGGSLQPTPRLLPRCRGRPGPGCRPIRTSASACAPLQPLIAGLRPGPPPRGWRAPGRGEPEEQWGRAVFLRPAPPPRCEESALTARWDPQRNSSARSAPQPSGGPSPPGRGPGVGSSRRGPRKGSNHVGPRPLRESGVLGHSWGQGGASSVLDNRGGPCSLRGYR